MLTRRALIRSMPAMLGACSINLQSGKASAFAPFFSLLLAQAERTKGPVANFPSTARDRIAVASWPFRSYIDSPSNHDRDRRMPGMDLKDFAANVVAKFNVHNIEPYNLHFHSLDDEYLSAFRAELLRTKVNAVNIAVDIQPSFHDPDPSIRKQAVVYAKKWVDVAERIGSPGIRTSNSRAGKSSPNLQRTVGSLKEVSAYAASKNVVINLENDDLVSEDAFFIVKVIETVDSPFLHALPDFGNSMMSGDASFDYRAMEAMFRQAFGICHVKDGETNSEGKRVTVDLQRTFDILKASGYRGYCSIEYDGPSDPYTATRDLIKRSVQYLE